MTPAYATALACALLIGAAAAGQAEEIKDKATSSVRIDFPDGVMRVETKTDEFQVVSYWPEGATDPKRVLVQQSVRVVQREDAEGPEAAEVSVATWHVIGEGNRAKMINLDAKGEVARPLAINSNPAYFAVTSLGCCGALDATQLYSLENGKLLMQYSGEPAWLEVPNSRGLMRIAGLDNAWSASFDPQYQADPSLVAILTYAAPTKPMRRVAIRLTAGVIDNVMSLPELAFLAADADPDPHFTLWSADGKRDPKSITDVSLRVTFTPDYIVTIPIVADNLDLAHAAATGGLAVAELPIK